MMITSYVPGKTMIPWPELLPLAKMLRVGQDTIFYYDTESGPSELTLVCIHGLGDEADSFRHLFPVLRNHYRIIALDLPGFGRSTASKKAVFKRHIEAVEQILNMIKGPAVLAGSSMGGMIAEAAAVHNPDQVKAVVLMDGVLPLKAKPNPGLLFMALPFLGKSWYRGFRKNHEAAYQSLIPFYANLEGMPRKDRDFLRRRVIDRVESGTQYRAYFSSLRSMMGYTVSSSKSIAEKIRSFPGKIMIIWGEEDLQMPPEAAQALQALRPDSFLVSFPQAGHLPHQEKPLEVADAMLQFMMNI